MSETRLNPETSTAGASAGTVTASASIIDGRDPKLWQDLGEHVYSSLFASRLWVEAVAETYGLNLSASAGTATPGHHEAALLFSHVADLRGERIVCFPFSDYFDPLVPDFTTWCELIEPLMHSNTPISIRCLRNPVVSMDERFRLVGQAAWHGVDLERPENEIWAGFDANARTCIRKALASGIAIRAGSSLEDVRKFYVMHCHVRKSRYRMLPQPLAFFERLHSMFSPADRLIVLIAELHGEPIAGIFLLVWKAVLYYKFAASVDRLARPNDLLIWEAIRLGQHRGLAQLDFGASDLNQPGLLRFKRKYATEEREIQRFLWEPPGYRHDRAAQANRVLSAITQLLTDPTVPDSITWAGGDTLYGQFC